MTKAPFRLRVPMRNSARPGHPVHGLRGVSAAWRGFDVRDEDVPRPQSHERAAFLGQPTTVAPTCSPAERRLQVGDPGVSRVYARQ